MSLSSESRVNTESNEYRQIVRVAKLYYEEELTQEQIGEQLGLSRVKVNRILQRARKIGVVKITIDAPESDPYDLEHALTIKYKLRDAIVVPDAEDGEALWHALAKGAAEWLVDHLEDGMRVGLGMGRTLSHVPLYFNPPEKINCSFCEVIGGAAETSGGFSNYNVTSKMAELAGGRAEYVYAPSILSSAEACLSFKREPSIADALERARQCDIILQSVGPVNKSALLYVHGYFDEKDLEELRTNGAVGDALGRFFDQSGNPFPTRLDDQILGITLADLKKVPWSVVVAGGASKVPVIKAALQGNLFSVLVTDTKTAEQLLHEG